MQHIFQQNPATEKDDWQVQQLYADLMVVEVKQNYWKGCREPSQVHIIESLRPDCLLERGCCPVDQQDCEDTLRGENGCWPLWLPQLASKDNGLLVARQKLSCLTLQGFNWTPRTLILDLGSLIMQVRPILLSRLE